MNLKVLDLFSGIGGFSLGLERTGGFETVAFCEIEPFPRRVLAKHWPKVPCYDDVRTLTGARLAADGIFPDCIVGGFPCQASSMTGPEGERSGLWRQFRRLIGEVRPRVVVVENVPALVDRGLSTLLGDLTELGYDAEWRVVRASDVGCCHQRARLFVAAYPQGTERRATQPDAAPAAVVRPAEPRERRGPDAADPAHIGRERDGRTRDRGAGPTNSRFGPYAGAVERHEAWHGPAPDPTTDGRLNPRFVEWMMSYPTGWVEAAGSRNNQLLCPDGGDQVCVVGSAVGVEGVGHAAPS